MKDYVYLVALSRAKLFDNYILKNLLCMIKEKNLNLQSFFELDTISLYNTFQLTDIEIQEIVSLQEKIPSISFEIENFLNQGYEIVSIFDDFFPTEFVGIKDSPSIIYTLGNKELLNQGDKFLIADKNNYEINTINLDVVQKNGIIVFANELSKTFEYFNKKNNQKGILILSSGIEKDHSILKKYHKYIVKGDLLVVSFLDFQCEYTKIYTKERNKYMYLLSKKIYIFDKNNEKFIPKDFKNKIVYFETQKLEPTKSIFISGSISIKELSEKLLLGLEKIISNQYDIFLGDADGIDKVIQKHFSKKRYERVTVCSMYDTPRTLESHLFRVYKVENTITSKSEREIQTIKDEFMTKNTDVSFVIWDGMSTGSYQNIIRSFIYNKELQVFLKDRYLTKEELTKENIEKIYEENHKYSLSEYLEIQKREGNSLVKTTKKMKEILVQEKILLGENEEVNTLYEDEITRHNNHGKTILKYSKSLLDQYFQSHIQKKADQLSLM